MDHRPPVAHRHDEPERSVVLPAQARTVGTSRSGDLIIVAHAGDAHVAVTVDDDVLTGLEDALTRIETVADTTEALDDGAFDPESVAVPAKLGFLPARAAGFTTYRHQVYVVLHAAGHGATPDLYVELRMDPPLLRRIEQHRNRRAVTRALRAAAVVLLVIAWAALVAGRLPG